jgi:RNA polymerase sigma-70 factor (ECF subfamily)
MDNPIGSDIDRQLVDQFRGAPGDGRREAFLELYERHAGRLHGFLLRATRSPHLADDLTQEAFLHALDGMDRFSGNSSFKTWIYRIAMNLLKDHHRKMKTTAQPDENASGGEPTPADAAERNEEVQRVRAALGALPEGLRAPVILVRFEGMKYREAAETLGLSVDALRMRVHRAYMALAAALKE